MNEVDIFGRFATFWCGTVYLTTILYLRTHFWGNQTQMSVSKILNIGLAADVTFYVFTLLAADPTFSISNTVI